MFCIANSCRYSTGPTLRIIGRSISLRTFSPIFNSVISYSNICNPDPCGGNTGESRTPKRCGASGPTKGKSGGGHTICYKSYAERGIIDHDYKNMALKRPMSPHLTIFAMTQPAGMSIVQRITGIILASYALLLSGGTLLLSNGIETYVSIIQSLDMSELTVSIIKVCLGLPFCYHYFNGIRFCIWNTARMLSLKQVYSTGYITILLAIVSAVAFAFFI